MVLLPLDGCRHLPGTFLSRLDGGEKTPARAVLSSLRGELHHQPTSGVRQAFFFSPGSKAVAQQRLERMPLAAAALASSGSLAG